PPAKGAAKPMLCLVQRAPANPHEMSIFLVGSTPHPFGDIGPYAIRGADQLLSYCIFCKNGPPQDHGPNLVRKFLRKAIDRQVFEIRPSHVPNSMCIATQQLTTNN